MPRKHARFKKSHDNAKVEVDASFGTVEVRITDEDGPTSHVALNIDEAQSLWSALLHAIAAARRQGRLR